MIKKICFALSLMALTTLSLQAQSSHYPMRSKIEATRVHAGSQHLEQIERTSLSGQRLEKNVMDYDDEGNLAVIDSYSYANSRWEPKQRLEYTYNDRGLLQRSAIYLWEDGEYRLTESEDVEQFTLMGQPKVVVISGRMEASGSAEVVPVLKQVVTGMHHDQPADYDLYAWEEDGWQLIGHSHIAYSEDGRHTSEVLTMSLYGVSLSQGVDIDYDDYGQPWRVDEYYLSMGEKLLSVVTDFRNEYDNDGLLQRRTITSSDGNDPVVDSYSWSRGTTTAIGGLAQGDADIRGSYYYDMNGRRHEGQPAQPGIYIINGRKYLKR